MLPWSRACVHERRLFQLPHVFMSTSGLGHGCKEAFPGVKGQESVCDKVPFPFFFIYIYTFNLDSFHSSSALWIHF